MMSSRDNWERLVAAVIKKQQLWEMFHSHSRTPSLSSLSSNFSGPILESSSDHPKFDIPVKQSPPIPFKVSSASPEAKNFASGLFPKKLFTSWYPRKKSRHQNAYGTLVEDDAGIRVGKFRKFSLQELVVATDNFGVDNLLTPHGFHKIYKGKLENGSFVAVKRMVLDPSVEQDMESRFHYEIEILSMTAHPNLIPLVGFCTTPMEQLLVYPFKVNQSVALCLRDPHGHGSHFPLNWATRKKIALGSANGFSYLHEECSPKIIHHDIKASNILLDEELEPIICDFELAVKFTDNTDTDVSEVVRGSIGHIAPEYLCSGKCSTKAYVFSYGVFLLELVSGLQAFDLALRASDDNLILLDWVRINLEDGEWRRFVDAKVYPMDHNEEMVAEELIKLAVICLDPSPERRPNMSEIVSMLEAGDELGKSWEHYRGS